MADRALQVWDLWPLGCMGFKGLCGLGCIEVEGLLGGAFMGLKGQQGLGSTGFWVHRVIRVSKFSWWVKGCKGLYKNLDKDMATWMLLRIFLQRLSEEGQHSFAGLVI